MHEPWREQREQQEFDSECHDRVTSALGKVRTPTTMGCDVERTDGCTRLRDESANARAVLQRHRPDRERRTHFRDKAPESIDLELIDFELDAPAAGATMNECRARRRI